MMPGARRWAARSEPSDYAGDAELSVGAGQPTTVLPLASVADFQMICQLLDAAYQTGRSAGMREEFRKLVDAMPGARS